MNELDKYDEAENEPEAFQDGLEGGLGDALGTMMAEFQRAKLRNWFIRTSIGAVLFGFLAMRFPWARWILYIWIPLATLSLMAILFLPKILQNKMKSVFQGGMEPGENPLGALFGSGGFGDADDATEDDEGEVIDVDSVSKTTLKDQLAILGRYGVTLDPARTIDDLLTFDDREAFEEAAPFALLLQALGSEMKTSPQPLPFSQRAWNLNPQGLEGDGYYVNIVKQLARLSGEPDRATEVQDFVDPGAERVELRYSLDGEPRAFSPTYAGTTCDGEVLEKIAKDLVRPGHGFYGFDAGEDFVIVYVSCDHGEMLDDLFQGDISPIALRQ